MAVTVFALSIHADYKCRHSGACCTAHWDVPVEVPVYRSLTAALAEQRLRVSEPARDLAPFIVEPDLPEETGAILERTDEGNCVFFERTSRKCIVHRDLGEPALPSTCRHFPRVAVRDWRGISLSLSHFCPTAAAMLFRDDVELTVIEHPPAFPPADYEGLSVDPEAYPPLLTPDVLMDVEGYSAWERHMVTRCADAEHLSESVLATLMRDARVLAQWKPGGATLAESVARLPRDIVEGSAHDTLTVSLAAHQEVIAAVPEDLRPESDVEQLEAAYQQYVRDEWARFRGPLKRYLGAKAFASWTAYQGRGIATIVRGLEAALAVVRVEAARECRDAGRVLDSGRLLQAIRSADFALNHLAVGEDLAAAWSAAELGATATRHGP
jgi:Fe-S-cluster containining protein